MNTVETFRKETLHLHDSPSLKYRSWETSISLLSMPTELIPACLGAYMCLGLAVSTPYWQPPGEPACLGAHMCFLIAISCYMYVSSYYTICDGMLLKHASEAGDWKTLLHLMCHRGLWRITYSIVWAGWKNWLNFKKKRSQLAWEHRWEEKIDAGSGKVYYQNHVTRCTQWDRPF